MASGDGVAEIEHDCRLSEKILRALVLKADHFTVADMRVQLGEDLREDVAKKVMAARGEQETPPDDAEAASQGAAETPSTDEAPADEPTDAAPASPEPPQSPDS
ncbi:MAG: hypothetical protein AMK72_09775 [Planctomycetes bacterium SM23_25]|nr:MAG: hypothetical protein AMK72_09775 [Planctomycetes bacterium SM23_25]